MGGGQPRMTDEDRVGSGKEVYSIVATVPVDRLDGFDQICRGHALSPIPRAPNGPHLFHFALRNVSPAAYLELKVKGLVR